MNIFDMVKPFLKEKGFTEEQINELERESQKPRKIEEMPIWVQEHEFLRNKRQEWQQKVNLLVEFTKNEEFEKIKITDIPAKPEDIDGYYYYLVGILKELYPYRKYFEVISILHKALHTIIDKQDILKEGLILTEIRRLRANNYNKIVENEREKAEEYVNKIHWDNFNTNYSTIDYLYNKELQKRNEKC